MERKPTRQELDNMTEDELQKFADSTRFWSVDDIKRGYSIFASDIMDEASYVDQIYCLNVFESSKEAAMQAERDGIKIIHDLPIDESDAYFEYYVDTPDNREIIKNCLAELGIEYNY